jgi:hypothetical protein
MRDFWDIQHHVVLLEWTDVSEMLIASNIRVMTHDSSMLVKEIIAIYTENHHPDDGGSTHI